MVPQAQYNLHLIASLTNLLFLWLTAAPPLGLLDVPWTHRHAVSSGIFALALASTWNIPPPDTYLHGSLCHFLQVFTEMSTAHEGLAWVPQSKTAAQPPLPTIPILPSFFFITVVHHLLRFIYFNGLPWLEHQLYEDTDFVLFIAIFSGTALSKYLLNENERRVERKVATITGLRNYFRTR